MYHRTQKPTKIVPGGQSENSLNLALYHNKLYCKYLSGHNDNFKVSEREGMHFFVHRIQVNYIDTLCQKT